jgi:two-component system, chemotaxis family, response regulator WspF
MRIAIVNDQRLVTESLRRIVLSNPDHQIAWTAENGREAVEMCARDLPDVILMDLVMPVLNGAEATRQIMQQSPCPVLVVTATVSGNYALVCEALGHGAYDAVCTPTLSDRPPAEAGAGLLSKLNSVDGIRRRSDSARQPTRAERDTTPNAPAVNQQQSLLVAIGSSTGGPQALEKIISKWPANFPASVVIVQHIAADFAGSLTMWLQERSQLEVRAAIDGDRPCPGVVLMAATNDHLVMKHDRRLYYQEEPVGTPFRPSVDAMFDSLVSHWPWPSVAVILTGIGRDGAQGLLRLRQRGWHTISQDEKTSVVYGMPLAAAEIGAAKRVLPIDDMAVHIAGQVTRLESTSPGV